MRLKGWAEGNAGYVSKYIQKNKRDYQENNHAYFYMTLRVIMRPVYPAFPQVLL